MLSLFLYRGNFRLVIFVIFITEVELIKAVYDNETSTLSQSSTSTPVISTSSSPVESSSPQISILHVHLNESNALGSRNFENIDTSGTIAGIVIGVLSGFTLIVAVAGYIIYKHFLRKTITSMNFDNPVYRKTTEDQFSLEKNQYHPAGHSYPSSLEPLTSPGTNEFV